VAIVLSKWRSGTETLPLGALIEEIIK